MCVLYQMLSFALIFVRSVADYITTATVDASLRCCWTPRPRLTQRKCLDFNWRIFHGQVMIENKLRHMKLSNGKCTLWKKEGENVEHILMLCNGINQIWKMIQVVIDKIYESNIKINKQTIMCEILNIEGWVWRNRYDTVHV